MNGDEETNAEEGMFAGARALVELVEAKSVWYETRCGEGSMAWRVWGEGEPVILLHGGSGSWMHWIKTIPVLAERYEVWAPDLPGLGDSAMPSPPLTPEICGEVVADGIRSLFSPDQRPHMVTFSFGAHVGVYAAAVLGQRLKSLTISGCAALGLPYARVEFLKEHSAMSVEERANVHRQNLNMLMIHDPDLIDPLAIYIQATNTAKARFRSRPFAGTDEIRKVLPKIRLPLRAIWGEHDQIAKPNIEGRFEVLRQSHPNLISGIIPDAGHWAAYEQPETFNEMLLEILATEDE